jgi:hypothetical protein
VGNRDGCLKPRGRPEPVSSCGSSIDFSGRPACSRAMGQTAVRLNVSRAKSICGRQSGPSFPSRRIGSEAGTPELWRMVPLSVVVASDLAFKFRQQLPARPKPSALTRTDRIAWTFSLRLIKVVPKADPVGSPANGDLRYPYQIPRDAPGQRAHAV